VVLEANNQEQLIFKHAISTVTTARPTGAPVAPQLTERFHREELIKEAAILIGTDEVTMVELRELAITAGARIVSETIQHRSRPDPATYLGKG
jgi:hypothetical protein